MDLNDRQKIRLKRARVHYGALGGLESNPGAKGGFKMRSSLDYERYCLYSRIRARSPFAPLDDIISIFGPEAVRFELEYKQRIADQLAKITESTRPSERTSST